jgi:cysteine desulfurase
MAGNLTQIYLDHAATTPMVQPAIDALTTQILKTGNASSLHSTGRSVRKELEEAREAIAKAAGSSAIDVIFTGSGTEANNLAIKGLYWLGAKAGKKTIITSTFEHHAVMDPIKWLAEHEGASVIEIAVSEEGVIDLIALQSAVTKHGEQVAFISIMHANNEIGTIQPVAEVVKIAGDIPVHTDAVQSFGKVPFNFKDLGLTAVTISAHKVGGPLGVAALILKKGINIEPVLHGGGQERDIRSGTFNAPGIIAFAAAASNAIANMQVRDQKIRALKDLLIKKVLAEVPDAWVNGATENSLPGIVNITFPGTDSEGLLLLLDMEGIACSTGSACSAGVHRPSHVLMSLGLTEDETTSSLRFSIGDSNNEGDIEKLSSVISSVVTKSRAASGKKVYK